MSIHENIDWSECPFVEIKPGVQSGLPIVRGTRLPAAAIVDNSDYGVSLVEISEQFEVPFASVEAVVTYAQSHRVANPIR